MSEDKHNSGRRIPLSAMDLPGARNKQPFKRDPEVKKLAQRLQAEGRQFLIMYFDVDEAADSVDGDIYSFLQHPQAVSSLLMTRAQQDQDISQAVAYIMKAVVAQQKAILQQVSTKARSTLEVPPAAGIPTRNWKKRASKKRKK